MALASFSALRAFVATPEQVLTQLKTSVSSGSGLFTSMWIESGNNVASAPSTAAAVDNSTLGALLKSNAGSGRQILVSGTVQRPSISAGDGMRSTQLLVVDRLSHQGGLVGNVTTSQTTNLPTAALSRYTSGVGVFAAVEVYSSLGANATRLDVTYTNSAGTGSRVGALPLVSANLTVNTWWPIPLQAGDLGVKSVESVQFSVATASAGNWGITLFKPIGLLIIPPSGHFDILDNVFWGEEILDDACIQLLPLADTSSDMMFTLNLAEC